MGELIQHFLEKTRSISYDYQVIRLILLFLGASIIIIVTQFLGAEVIELMSKTSQDYAQVNSIELEIRNATLHEVSTVQLEDQLNTGRQAFIGLLFSVVLLIILLFFIPIILSLVLSKITSTNQIISPAYMQVIVFSYFLIFFTFSQNIPDSQRVPTMMIMIIYTIVAGMAQNSFVIWLIGIRGSDTDLIKHSFKIYTNLRTLEDLFTSEPQRGDMNLKRAIEELRNGFLLKSRVGVRFDTWIEIIESTNINEVFLNMVNFEKGSFELKQSLRLQGYARKQFLYIKDILSNTQNNIRFEVISTDHANRITEEVIEDSKGATSQIEGISKMAIFKIFLFVISGILIGYLYYVGDATNTILGIVTVSLYLIFELTRFTRRKILLSKH